MNILTNIKNILYEIDIFNNVLDINDISDVGQFKRIIDNFYSLYSLEFSNLKNIEDKKEIVQHFSEIHNSIQSDKIFEDPFLKQIVSNLENSGIERSKIKQFLLNISNHYNENLLKSNVSNISDFLSLKNISPKLQDIFFKYYEVRRDDFTSAETDFFTWIKTVFFGQIRYIVGNAMFFPLVLLYMFLHRKFVSKVIRTKFKQFKRLKF